jgi:hypothetical protein
MSVRARTNPIKSECVSVPLSKDDPRYADAVAIRNSLARQAFTTGLPPLYNGRIYLPPTDAYTVAFLKLADSGVIALVQQTFADERQAIENGQRLPFVDKETEEPFVKNQQPDEPGFIYAFRNVLDRPDLIKIGRTRRTPRKRGSEWEHDLAPEEGQQIVMLFSAWTRYNKFAERVVKSTLLCEHQGKRVNERTGRLLTEFYNISNFMELKLFIMMIVGYVNWWGAGVRKQFQTTSPIYLEWANAARSKTAR